MYIVGQEILNCGLVGEVKSQDQFPNMAFVGEIKHLMDKYKVDWMWFGWSKFGATKGDKPCQK